MTVEGRTHRPIIDHDKCNTCSICLKACPAEIMPEMRREDDSLRAKIYGGADNYIKINIEKAFGLPSCQDTCPLHQDVRGYVNLISKGQYREALELIRETNPLPSVCGYQKKEKCA
jgi:epoxyqueuosine reductase QueG